LLGVNLNGTSDPYAIITCGAQKRFRYLKHHIMQFHNIETIAWSGKFMWTNSAGHSLRISWKTEEESTALFFACLKSQSTSPKLLTGAVSGGIFAFGCKVRWLQAPGIHCGVKNLTSTLRSSLCRCVTVFDLCANMQFSKVVIFSFL